MIIAKNMIEVEISHDQICSFDIVITFVCHTLIIFFDMQTLIQSNCARIGDDRFTWLQRRNGCSSNGRKMVVALHDKSWRKIALSAVALYPAMCSFMA